MHVPRKRGRRRGLQRLGGLAGAAVHCLQWVACTSVQAAAWCLLVCCRNRTKLTLVLVLILQVHLCGSFTRWVETIPMASVDGTPGVFAVVVHLPPG
jgi:hypothetical protein